MSEPRRLRRPLVMLAVMAASFMIAVEATIVSTAMPQIAGQLGDLRLYSWVFASFLLSQTATTVVFGKLADLYGRKPVLLVGIGIFLVGTLLCGFAWSMPALIGFRLVQGVGAGAIQPISITVVGDLYSAEERGKIQGYLASVWGISSVLGPLAGGLIIGHASWAWVFWINVPVGIAAAAGFIAFLHEDIARRRVPVDAGGAVLFAVAVAALMVGVTEIGTPHADIVLGAGVVFLLSAALFVAQERRVADPMMDFRLWAHRPIATANVATLLAGTALIGLTTFLPMYVQGVLAQSALVAGFALTVMVLGWPIGATLAARNFARFGLRTTLLLGAMLLPVGAFGFVLMRPGLPVSVAGAGSFVMGLGMGLLSTSAIVIIQQSVGWAERGAATASNIFARNLGSTLGATVLGSILNARLSGNATIGYEQVRDLLDRPSAIGDAAVRAVLGEALHLTFWAVFVVALVAALLALLVPSVSLTAAPREIMAE